MSELGNLEKMRQGINTRFPVIVRGMSVTLRPLSIMEEDQIESEVYAALMAFPEGNRTRTKETRLLATKSIQLASTSDVGQSDMKITEYELNRCTTDELQYIWKQYLIGMDKINPSIESIEVEKLNSLAEELKKNPSALIEQSSSLILNLVRHLLTREEQPKDN